MQERTPVSTDQIEKWRKETPGCSQRIHLNNAGAALMPQPVIDTIQAHLALENQIGGYEAADAVSDQIENAYASVAGLVGGSPENIAMVGNATIAISLALSSFDYGPEDVIITTNVDYSSNQIMLLNLAQRYGVKVHRAADLPEGGADPDSVRQLVRDHNPKLLLMSWIPTHSGLVQDAVSVGEICRESGVPFLLDACQAVGQIPVDVHRLNVDFLAATSRKFLRGPRGMGFLYVSSQMLNQGKAPLFPDTHGARWSDVNEFELARSARRFENWEFPVALQLGMGRAAEYAAEAGMKRISERNTMLADYARNKIAGLKGARILDDGSQKSAIVSVGLNHADAEKAVEALRIQQVNTSSASRSASIIDMDAKQARSILRISPHYYNTRKEIDECAYVLEEFLRL